MSAVPPVRRIRSVQTAVSVKSRMGFLSDAVACLRALDDGEAKAIGTVWNKPERRPLLPRIGTAGPIWEKE